MTSISSPRRPQRQARRSRPYRPRILREEHISPVKALGQHFLTDANYVRRILEAVDPQDLDAVVEVGPGLGVLTEGLLAVSPRLIAVELDGNLAARLRQRHAGAANLTVVEADVLSRAPESLLAEAGLPAGARYAVVGNLPYNAGAAILRHFLEAENQPSWLVVMLQREVADNVCAAPGELGLLGVSVQVYAEARRLFNVQPRAFYPPPRVMSTVLRLDVRPEPLVVRSERERFFRVVRAGFSAPRKRLRNSLAQGLGLPPAVVEARVAALGLDPAARPAELRIEDWLRLGRDLEL